MSALAVLAACLLLAAPASADVEGKAVGQTADANGPAINGCSAKEAQSLRLALGVAAGFAGDCLGGGGGLAPDIGRKVLDLYGKKKLALFCDGDSDGNGNAATTFKDGVPQISVFSRTNEKANDWSAAGLGAVLLHELIHAADPGKALIASQALHDKAYPDRVYACHLACTGGAGGSDGMKSRLALLMHAADGTLTLQPSGASAIACPAQGGCGFQRLMGALCGPEGDSWVALERAEEKSFEQTGCLLRAVAVDPKEPCKAQVCADIRAQVKQASAGGPPPASLVGALMIHLYDVLKASRSPKAAAALPEQDAAALEALTESGVLAGCAR